MNKGPAWKTTAFQRQNAFTKLDFLRARLVLKLLILGGFMVFLSLFTIWSRVQIVELGYQINELKRAGETLANRNKMLKLELSLLASPERIGKLAREKLKMGPPGRDKILSLE